MTAGSSQNNGFLSIKITAMEKKSVMGFSYSMADLGRTTRDYPAHKQKKIQEVSGEEKIGRNGGDKGLIEREILLWRCHGCWNWINW